ncbi:MAG: HNH nuclease family protein [Desulfuromonadales bacterium]|nr:HNH nuclease family protein [Desulfuromonadales bacterium]MBN2791193.1 HNH nuclease family protein [Desulfuromonadales bacterium]
MAKSHRKLSEDEQNRIVAKMLKEQKERQGGYREQALKLFPWVCARCMREFEGKNVRELTVHHIDHNHDNNPADGSNWELLCLYCHDHEHTRSIQEDRADVSHSSPEEELLSHSPFAALADRFGKKPENQ